MAKIDPKNYDVRILEYHLRRGNIAPEDLQKQLDELPDSADNAVETQVRFEPTVARQSEDRS